MSLPNRGASTIEVMVDAECARSLDFFPIGKQVRSVIDFTKMRGDAAAKLLERFPEPIPGQIIGINLATGDAWLREPLHDPKYAMIRRKIEKAGYDIPPAQEDFHGVHIATWLHWLRRAVDAKCVTVLVGEVPKADEIEGEPRVERFGVRSRDTIIETLVVQNRDLMEMVARVLDMTPDQRQNLVNEAKKSRS